MDSPLATPPKASTAGYPPAKRLWNPQFLTGLGQAAVGDPIRFELTGGVVAGGRIGRLKHADNRVIYVSGSLSEPETGEFFFQKQSRPGVAGAYVGLVEFPASRKAYRLEPSGLDGAPELVARPLEKVVCLEASPPSRGCVEIQEIPPLKPEDFPAVPIPNYQRGIVVLESLPGSTPVIYLDFQGGSTLEWDLKRPITYERPQTGSGGVLSIVVPVDPRQPQQYFRIGVY
jgi:hypothetical protein